MQVSLLTWSSAQLQALHTELEALGYEVIESRVRAHDAALSDLIGGLAADVLVFESLGSEQQQDIAHLEPILSSHPGLAVLMLCEQRDADTLVLAMQAGIREVLVSPPTGADLKAAMARCVQRAKNATAKNDAISTTIAFMSCKGGSGATFLATNFASILAKDYGKKTAFLDLDLQCGDAAYYLSPNASPSDIAELTSQIDRLDGKLLTASMMHIGPNFDILAAPDDPEANYTMSAVQLERLLTLVAEKYDMVVLDIDHVLTDMTLKAIEMSDTVYLVMENLLPFVRNAKRIVAKLRNAGYDERKIRLIVNRYDDSDTINLDRIEKAVGLKVSHTTPSSFVDVAQAINTGVPLTEVNAKNPVVHVLRDIANEFNPHHAKKRFSWVDRLLGSES